MRLFVAIDLDEPRLSGVRRIIAQQRAVLPNARWLAPEQLHVTLSFLGQVADAELLDVSARVLETARRFSPFAIRVRAAGGFPNAWRPSVLWLGVEADAPDLAGVAAGLEAAWRQLGRSVEAREYRPHLTLARASQRGGDARLGQLVERLAAVDLGSCEVREIVLYRSDSSATGARYTALLRAPLGRQK